MADEQPQHAPKVTVRVGSCCPQCRGISTMSSWERTEWHAGNHWKSTCIRCGASERKQ